MLTFETDGAARHDRAALVILPELLKVCDGLPQNRAGVRLRALDTLRPLLTAGPIAAVATDLLGPELRPVRAILFDKTAAVNWSLGWHQDRTIAVRRRIDTPGFNSWNTKAGFQHVEPPFGIIEAMVTIRVHLDPVPNDNAPLLIVAGSHRLGRIDENRIAPIVASSRVETCLADAGDLWVYATPILHASAAGRGTRRRVLQIDYSAANLPNGLEWLGV